MSKAQSLPIALTIAGSDSGGGAGIQADLKVFAALGVHGTSVITCITAQNPERVISLQPASPAMVRQQLQAVTEVWKPAAIKTGMLFSAEIIRAVAKVYKNNHLGKLVVDPVMVATSGRILLNPDAIKVLKRLLLPNAALVTPNLAEAVVLMDAPGQIISNIEEMRQAAQAIYSKYNCAVLLKGGHLPKAMEAADIFYDGTEELLLIAPFKRGIKTHGTGCTLSAAITGYLAKGYSLPGAVVAGKRFISQALAGAGRAGKYNILNYQPKL